MREKVIVTAAVTGSRPTKEMNPAVPYTPEEISQAVLECYEVGAAIAHIHVRDPETGVPAFDMELFRQVLEPIRESCDILINITTSGLFLEGEGDELIEQRLQPLQLQPDLCSLDIGSINFRSRAFVNPPAWGERAAQAMRAHGVKPEIEVFDAGHIYQAVDYVNRGLFADPAYFQLCMGARWGVAATPEDLLFMKSKLPPGAQWSVLGVGAGQIPMITMGILLGGHIRVGLEDNLYLRKGVLAESNAQLVEMAVELVHQLQFEIATPAEAREILGL
jgi:3-keto-5-aminohexanoate cleavage enzyme